MVNIVRYTVVILTFLTIFSFRESENSAIVGTWKWEGNRKMNIFPIEITFSKNYNFNQIVNLDPTFGQDTFQLSGTYKIRNNILFLKYGNATEEDSYTIHKLDKSRLIISHISQDKDVKGEIQTFQKI